MKGSCIHPQQIPKRKVSKPPQENRKEKAPKITKKGKWERHNQASRNHVESSIHTMMVHTRSSLPPNHPYLSQYLTMKLSSYSYKILRKKKRKIAKQMR
jgi:hypothetical protein